MNMWTNRKKRNRGQTALEYALVIGVISVGVIFAGKRLFGGDEKSAASLLMKEAIDSATGTIDAKK